MRLIKIYIVLFLLNFIIGCDINDESDQTKFVYYNASDHHVYFEAYFNSERIDYVEVRDFDLHMNEEKCFLQSPENWTGPLGIPLFRSADSIITVFDDTLAITYDKGRLDGNPMRIENYKLLEGEEDPYIYFFEFTNEDYERALERGRVIN